MDYEWAERVLEEWLEGVHRVADSQPTRLIRDSPALREVLEREDQVRRVVARINNTTQLPVIVSRYREYYVLDDGAHVVRYALGRLRTDHETRTKLGTTAPQMAADALHPIIWQAAENLWADEHFGEAVQRAATFLNAEVQSRIGRTDLSDASLMQEAFSSNPPAHGRPRLRWPGPDEDLTVRSMRDGIRAYSSGCYQTIRNPSTHSTVSISRQEGLERLAALSLLAHWIDGCEVLSADNP